MRMARQILDDAAKAEPAVRVHDRTNVRRRRCHLIEVHVWARYPASGVTRSSVKLRFASLMSERTRWHARVWVSIQTVAGAPGTATVTTQTSRGPSLENWTDVRSRTSTAIGNRPAR